MPKQISMEAFTNWRGEKTSIGDVIDFLGQSHKIIKIESYDHPSFHGEKWAIAFAADGWGITLEGE